MSWNWLTKAPWADNDDEKEIVRFKPPQNFNLPDDWIIEEKPRPNSSDTSHRVDRYYYEPGTGKKFRSLLAVQRYLAEEETKDYVTNERMMSDTSGVRSGTGKRSAPVVRSRGESATKRYSVAEEEGFPPKQVNFSVQSTPTKTDSQRKFNSGNDVRGSSSIHSLSRPPAKVSWVLSGSDGFWSPFVDDTTVPESQKLKWAEAFVQSVHHGVSNR